MRRRETGFFAALIDNGALADLGICLAGLTMSIVGSSDDARGVAGPHTRGSSDEATGL